MKKPYEAIKQFFVVTGLTAYTALFGGCQPGQIKTDALEKPAQTEYKPASSLPDLETFDPKKYVEAYEKELKEKTAKQDFCSGKEQKILEGLIGMLKEMPPVLEYSEKDFEKLEKMLKEE